MTTIHGIGSEGSMILKQLAGSGRTIFTHADVSYPWEYSSTIIRPEMTEDFCRKWKAAGCSCTQIGLEFGSQHVLDLMKKEQEVATCGPPRCRS